MVQVILLGKKLMKLTAYNVNKLKANSYVITNNDQSIVIDPCVSYETIFANSNLKPTSVFITHGHFDHIDQLSTYLNRGLEIYMHENAYSKLKDPKKNYSIVTGSIQRYNLDCEQVLFVDEGDKLKLIGLDIEILYLPGHTDCSIGILFGEHLFCGDVILKHGIGRYDLYTSSEISTFNTIKKLKESPINYFIYPGHGDKTTLDFEIKNNPYFRSK